MLKYYTLNCIILKKALSLKNRKIFIVVMSFSIMGVKNIASLARKTLIITAPAIIGLYISGCTIKIYEPSHDNEKTNQDKVAQSDNTEIINRKDQEITDLKNKNANLENKIKEPKYTGFIDNVYEYNGAPAYVTSYDVPSDMLFISTYRGGTVISLNVGFNDFCAASIYRGHGYNVFKGYGNNFNSLRMHQQVFPREGVRMFDPNVYPQGLPRRPMGTFRRQRRG